MSTSKFHRIIVGIHGEKGERWLRELPARLEKWQEEHHADILAPFELSYNFVAPVKFHDGRSAVFKLGFSPKEIGQEIHALENFKGGSIAGIMDADPDNEWLLIEQLKPGKMLKESTVSDSEGVKIAASILPTLWKKPSTDAFPKVKDWAKGLEKLRSRFQGGTGPLPPHLVEKAEFLFSHLLENERDVFLLHGDLHHGNILFDANRGWTAIDAKGVIGEKEYDCIQFLINELLEQSNPFEILDQRITLFCELLNLDSERMIQWGFCHSVLSASWSTEEGGDSWKWGINCAELFDRLLS
ncbi:aminoglycoside phosphotransferase family protein [Falsibacillus pallidus]|uniref:aminoglycoside phosphotransferase family protein n=1 Tax=Falsibacillus pallidus TaxID=493781 RepID=UPI003D961739